MTFGKFLAKLNILNKSLLILSEKLNKQIIAAKYFFETHWLFYYKNLYIC